MHDLIAEIDRTSPAVSVADLRGAGGHVVELHRTLHAPVADVWKPCTHPDRVRRWFLPLAGDLRPGGSVHAVMCRSAASWGAAHASSGVDAAVAREAAALTRDFYAPAGEPDA
jgi:uncharacterized protein YndB with AHSA1/START domain